MEIGIRKLLEIDPCAGASRAERQSRKGQKEAPPPKKIKGAPPPPATGHFKTAQKP